MKRKLKAACVAAFASFSPLGSAIGEDRPPVIDSNNLFAYCQAYTPSQAQDVFKGAYQGADMALRMYGRNGMLHYGRDNASGPEAFLCGSKAVFNTMAVLLNERHVTLSGARVVANNYLYELNQNLIRNYGLRMPIVPAFR